MGADVVGEGGFAADVGVGGGDVGEFDVDEVLGGGEFLGVDFCYGEGEFVALGDGEGDGVADFVEGPAWVVLVNRWGVVPSSSLHGGVRRGNCCIENDLHSGWQWS